MAKIKNQKKKVVVALSGGVDSAVAAAILKKQGHEVVGVFFELGNWGKSSLIRARKIARKLNIPLKIIHARKEFKKRIIDYFVSSYKNGLTPNPCVVCNREMKFRLLYDLMQKEKADYVATGHYARTSSVIASEAKQSRNFSDFSGLLRHRQLAVSRNDKIILLEAKDKTKDQSYFLYGLDQKELARIIFPLGNLKKSEVKKMANKFGFPDFGSDESQDICFLPNTDLNSFLKKYIKIKPGKIVDEKKNILGNHRGLPLYTIGQRKGIEIGGKGPYFVIGKDNKKSEIIVSNNSRKLLTNEFRFGRANWINKDLKFPLTARVQIRYHAPKLSGTIEKKKDGKWTVKSERKSRAVTAGQAVVIYKDGEVLGGGIIKG